MSIVEERPAGFFKSDLWLFSLMLFSAVISLLAAFMLSVDAIELAKNPDAELACDINAVISCGTVASQWQSAIFGFPNAFIGLICEPVVITIAIAGLTGVKFKKGFMAVAQVIYLLGLIFALWLFYQSAFVIHAFCPWCLLVTLGTTMTFFTLLRYNFIHNNFYLRGKVKEVSLFSVRTGIDTAIEIILIISVLATIVIKYGSSLLG